MTPSEIRDSCHIIRNGKTCGIYSDDRDGECVFHKHQKECRSCATR